jgi:hypothetical protein
MQVRTLPRLVCQREPAPAVLPVYYQRGGSIVITVNQQHDHLAVAFIRSVMRAWTIRMCQSGDMQIEGLYCPKAAAVQFLAHSSENRGKRIIHNNERHQGAHLKSYCP